MGNATVQMRVAKCHDGGNVARPRRPTSPNVRGEIDVTPRSVDFAIGNGVETLLKELPSFVIDQPICP